MISEDKVFELSLYDVFDILRDGFSLQEAFQHITALVFLKWLEESNERPSIFHKIHVVPTASYRYLLNNLDEKDLGFRVNLAFELLEDLNEDELRDVFLTLDFGNARFSGRNNNWTVLKKLLLSIDEANLHRSKGPGFAKYTLDQFFACASSSVLSPLQGPEFNTPHEIARIVANIVNVSHNEVIYDPACGSGHLLLECAKDDQRRSTTLYGNEKNRNAWMIAKINLISHGYSSTKIINRDSLDPKYFARLSKSGPRFNVAVAHPPWGLRWNEEFESDDLGQYDFGTPPRSSADFAFIQHMLATLCKKNGRMVAVMSTGVLTRSGAERKIRERLIGANLIDAVIALPDKLFQNTAIAGALLIFKTNRNETDVFFYDARRLAKPSKGKNIFPDSAVIEISEAYRNRQIEPGVSNLVSLSEIRLRDYSLSVDAFVESVNELEVLSLAEVRLQRKTLESELREIDHDLKNLLSSIDSDNLQ
ncbi:type I restriction-modification system subunit M [Massilia sp. G4R7]|uniref:site-specific DNA-methyltransferase (adenine-specific) n=1 Tax=Massilia phyllostachyos TaxID=2898585 RepID=A0ABS8Q9Z7_9BURK|nr:N-6 DNA methylase [Massilia phyllostachyos]MCD2517771.1 type I restriction-modification system subunit M [Massilia phyllostachyos]